MFPRECPCSFQISQAWFFLNLLCVCSKRFTYRRTSSHLIRVDHVHKSHTGHTQTHSRVNTTRSHACDDMFSINVYQVCFGCCSACGYTTRRLPGTTWAYGSFTGVGVFSCQNSESRIVIEGLYK